MLTCLRAVGCGEMNRRRRFGTQEFLHRRPLPATVAGVESEPQKSRAQVSFLLPPSHAFAPWPQHVRTPPSFILSRIRLLPGQIVADLRRRPLPTQLLRSAPPPATQQATQLHHQLQPLDPSEIRRYCGTRTGIGSRRRTRKRSSSIS